MIQYVDNYYVGGVNGEWLESTHVEMEIWNHAIGYGWDGTYFAFFTDGTYFINNKSGVKEIVNKVTIISDENSNYKYKISYEIFIGFDNNIENPADGPYGYVQFMSHTPNEGTDGYERASMITKDGNRVLWIDDCKSYGINRSGWTACRREPDTAGSWRQRPARGRDHASRPWSDDRQHRGSAQRSRPSGSGPDRCHTRCPAG